MRDSQRRPGSQSALHSANRRRVEALLQHNGDLTQAEIARETYLAPATVSNIVRSLRADGMVSVHHDGSSRRRLIRLTRSAGLVAGLDYGHRHISAVVADRSGEVLAEQRRALGTGLSAEEALEAGDAVFSEALDECDVQRSAVQAVGMGLPAPIDDTSGQVGALSILPGWVGVNAAEMASGRLQLPVHVDNDANLGARAEHLWGAGRGVESMAFVKLSEGVGAGLVLDGRLFTGRDGTSGEVGHQTLDDLGAVCRCGNRGCLETVIAARSVTDLLRPRFERELTISDVVAHANDGDLACARVLADTGHQAGSALANLCNLFNPELIVVGGELAQAGDMLLAPMRESVRRFGIPTATSDLEIRRGDLGAHAIPMGTVALALHHLGLAP